MMFVDLLHTWIASERGGTEQTLKLSGDRALGQPLAAEGSDTYRCPEKELTLTNEP